MATAVVTFTYNESVNLPIWRKYYGQNFGEKNLFVADRGTNDGSIDDLGDVNLLKLPRNEFDEFQKTDFISLLQQSLLNFYDTVIITDCDEILVPDPAKFASLSEYIDKNDFEHMNAIGLDVIHIIDREAPLDLSAKILSQRSYARFQPSECKALIARKPMKWLTGFHSCNRPPRFDGMLYLFHTKTMDYGAAMARQKINQDTIWSERSLSQNLGQHHRYDFEKFVHEGFFVPSNEIRQGRIAEFNFEAEIAEFLSKTVEHQGSFYVPMQMPKKYVRIPEIFRDSL